MKIIHIVDSLPFYVGGVSDYAYKLSYELKEKSDIESYFITVKDYHDFDRSYFDNIYNIHPKRNLFETVKNIVDSHFDKNEKINIILEYVGYGYQKRGCPIWLLLELKRLKKKLPLHIITMFHELYAVSDNLKTSTYWFSWLQKYITKEIFHLSNAVKTNTVKYYNELKHWDNEKVIEILPVFSNIGEINTVENFDNREDSAVVFGGLSSRARIYEDQERLEKVLQELGINIIYDIGPGDLEIKTTNYVVKKLGKLDSSEVEKIMGRIKFGFLDYENMPLEKSGIFAAYAAYEVCPVVFQSYNGNSIYEKNIDYVFINELKEKNFSNIVNNVKQKYFHKASLSNHIKSFLKELSS